MRSTGRDHHWVALCFAISRSAQREKFRVAGYASEPDRRELIVAEVLAERQERSANGLWGEPVPVAGYEEKRIKGDTKIELVTNVNNQLGVKPEDEKYIEEYRQKLESSGAQAEILRPEFQRLLQSGGKSDDLLQWRLPREIRGAGDPVIYLTDNAYGVEFAPEAPTSLDAAWIKDTLEQAETKLALDWVTDLETLRNERNYQEARGLVEDYLRIRDRLEIVSNAEEAHARQKQDAEDFLTEHQEAFGDLPAELVDIEQQQREAITNVSELGDNVEPAWLTDTSVVPGKTYRYRVSLAALNQYAGMANQLEDGQDAGLLVVHGEWSDWSAPIMVRPDKYLFFTRGQEKRNSARVELHQWTKGEWTRGTKEVHTGDSVVFKSGKTKIDYGAVVAGIRFDQPYEARVSARHGDGFRYKNAVTDVLTLVRADGVAEERLSVEDMAERKRITREIDAEKEKESGVDDKPGRGRFVPRPDPRPPDPRLPFDEEF